METRNVNLSVVLGLAERVIEGRKAQGLHVVDLGQRDLYHIIPEDQRFSPYDLPQGPFSMGSLTDDLTELMHLLRDPDRAATPVDVARLGHVLCALAAAM